MSRGDQLLRQWGLLKRLQTRGQGIPLRELARLAGVSERTEQRDLDLLRALGFPLQHDEDEFGKRFWGLPADFFKSGPLVLTLTQAISLHLAEQLLTPLAGTHLGEGLHGVLEQIRAAMPGPALEHFSSLNEIIAVRRMGATDYRPHADTLRRLLDAVRAGTTVRLTYRALWRHEEYTTDFDPYGVVYYEGDLFVIGHSHRASAIRLFKLTRIRDLVDRGKRFPRPSRFSLDAQFRTSFGIMQGRGRPVEVVVRFTGAAAALIEERVWHESQELAWESGEEVHGDGPADHPDHLRATYRLSDLVEFKRWIKGFGDQAEILKPARLRDELRDELRAAARLYES